MTYTIIRHFQRSGREVIKDGLTLAEAHTWCQDPNTSSSTCTDRRGRKRTKDFGPWFDSYEGDRT